VAVAVALAALLTYSSILAQRSLRIDAAEDELVIMVVIDALRRDRLGTFGNTRPTSPFIDGLAREGLVFADVIAASSQTVPAVASLWTSQRPSTHGLQWWSGSMSFDPADPTVVPILPAKPRTMAEAFSAAGFHTAAVVASPWLQARRGFGRGFADYVEVDCLSPTGGFKCDGRAVNDAALRIVEAQRGRKKFLYLHYMDVHAPYGLNDKRCQCFRPSTGRVVNADRLMPGLSAVDLRYTIGVYDEDVRYVDSLLERLVTDLRRLQADRHLLLIVTSDHGDELYDHGGLGHGTTLYSELIDTFAILWSPSRLRPHRTLEPMASIDLVPSLLKLYGIPIPSSMAGRSALPSVAITTAGSTPIVSELGDKKAVVAGPWKMIRNLPGGTEEFYRLGNGGGEEQLRGRETREPRWQPLRAVLDGLPTKATASTEAVDPATHEALRALGYLQ
jgi:arylsulfatase A-like enzyme